MQDVLRWPLIGPLLRMRWSRLIGQIALALAALLVLLDGFTGPLQPHRNLATLLPWVHYRGLVVLALLAVGNLFCMACPFALPRTLAWRWQPRRRWPRFLRNKLLGILLLVLILWAYEAFDLWASPLWTAWVVLAYFGAAFVLEMTFAESPFCKYLCPLGQFNFVHATVAPLQVTVREPAICRTCEGHPCVNGTSRVAGCGTELYPLSMRSNLDCVLCLDCVRACPYDNVALAVRQPLAELRDPAAWPVRWDLAWLVLVLTFAAVGNALGMVAPGYAALNLLAKWGVTSPALALAILHAGLHLALPLAVGLGVAWLSRRALHARISVRRVLGLLAPAMVPLSLGIWLAHYGFHFLTAAGALQLAWESFLARWGIAPFRGDLAGLLGRLVCGQPSDAVKPLVPLTWLFPFQVVSVTLGLLGSLWALRERAQRAFPQVPWRRVVWPWSVLALILALAALYLFSLPMEMRGMPMSGMAP